MFLLSLTAQILRSLSRCLDQRGQGVPVPSRSACVFTAEPPLDWRHGVMVEWFVNASPWACSKLSNACLSWTERKLGRWQTDRHGWRHFSTVTYRLVSQQSCCKFKMVQIEMVSSSLWHNSAQPGSFFGVLAVPLVTAGCPGVMTHCHRPALGQDCAYH